MSKNLPPWLEEVFHIFKAARKRDYLVLDEVLQIQPSRENPVDLAHLGILLVLDKQRNGRFYRKELIEFHKGYVSEASNHRNVDWQAQFQAYCTLQLWDLVSSDGGEEKFVEWFCKLFCENGSRATTTFSGNEGVVYLRSGTVKTLHGILNIQKTYGLDYQSFFDLLQRVAEEENAALMKLQDPSYDDVLPLDTLRHFARDFLSGFVNIMTTLGFEPQMLGSPEERAAAKKRKQEAEEQQAKQRELKKATMEAAAAKAKSELKDADTSESDDDDDDDDETSSSTSESETGSASAALSEHDVDEGKASDQKTSGGSTRRKRRKRPSSTTGAAMQRAASKRSGSVRSSGKLEAVADDAPALHRAARGGVTEQVEALLGEGNVDVNQLDSNGWSPLLHACASGSVQIARVLLKADADASVTTPHGAGPLHLLVQYSASNRQGHSKATYVKVVKQLIGKHASVEPDEGGETPLHVATRVNNLVALELLLGETNVDVEARDAAWSRTALHVAARAGATDAAALLVKHGADINATTCIDSDTTAKSATNKSNKHNNDKNSNNNSDNNNNNSNDDDDDDENNVTAVVLAETHGHNDCAALLRDRGHDAVQLAAALRGHDAKRVSSLIAAHPRLVEFTDAAGRNALHFFCAKPELNVVRIILETPFGAKLVDQPDNTGSTPLHAACEAFDYKLISLLLDFTTDATRVTSDGSTPLHLLANRVPDKAKLASNVIDRLINAGVDVNAVNADGDTAMHLCALSGNEPLARSLLNAPEMQLSITNTRGETALAYSQRAGTKHIAKLIAVADARQLTTAPSTPKQGSPSATARSSRANSDASTSGLKIGQLLKTIGKMAKGERNDDSASDSGSARGIPRRSSDGSPVRSTNGSPRDAPPLAATTSSAAVAERSISHSPLRNESPRPDTLAGTSTAVTGADGKTVDVTGDDTQTTLSKSGKTTLKIRKKVGRKDKS